MLKYLLLSGLLYLSPGPLPGWQSCISATKANLSNTLTNDLPPIHSPRTLNPISYASDSLIQTTLWREKLLAPENHLAMLSIIADIEKKTRYDDIYLPTGSTRLHDGTYVPYHSLYSTIRLSPDINQALHGLDRSIVQIGEGAVCVWLVMIHSSENGTSPEADRKQVWRMILGGWSKNEQLLHTDLVSISAESVMRRKHAADLLRSCLIQDAHENKTTITEYFKSYSSDKSKCSEYIQMLISHYYEFSKPIDYLLNNIDTTPDTVIANIPTIYVQKYGTMNEKQKSFFLGIRDAYQALNSAGKVFGGYSLGAGTALDLANEEYKRNNETPRVYLVEPFATNSMIKKGNILFPRDAIITAHITNSITRNKCPGATNYYIPGKGMFYPIKNHLTPYSAQAIKTYKNQKTKKPKNQKTKKQGENKDITLGNRVEIGYIMVQIVS